LGDAITDFRRTVGEVVEVEPTYGCLVVVYENIESSDAGSLISQENTMAFGELLKELIAAVADRLREVHAVRQFEIQER
jgi:hypothetical protein